VVSLQNVAEFQANL